MGSLGTLVEEGNWANDENDPPHQDAHASFWAYIERSPSVSHAFAALSSPQMGRGGG
eukprot:CAMPEP_0114113162 /NCGR_PEP_ID=MMETSP0043_2-20121206/2766_1 /TAXON_ID=464988 /ORGANISM="Hemiselmis andersenii, Strain CCMP644" /LENGTH=56 /DNA_ID=CAMNT_0001205295 /DNA_START=136 /DNA_END=302 /DNA_ORIENTATION=+